MNDASQCGVICFKSFKGLADRHGFEPDFSPVGLCFRLCAMCFVHPGFHGVVAARDASIMGGNFLDERSQVRGICPVSVDAAAQSAGVAASRDTCSTELRSMLTRMLLVQRGYNNQSLCLYITLGFVVREPLSLLGGLPIHLSISGYAVRPATRSGFEPCNRLPADPRHDRVGELAPTIHDGTATCCGTPRPGDGSCHVHRGMFCSALMTVL